MRIIRWITWFLFLVVMSLQVLAKGVTSLSVYQGTRRPVLSRLKGRVHSGPHRIPLSNPHVFPNIFRFYWKQKLARYYRPIVYKIRVGKKLKNLAPIRPSDIYQYVRSVGVKEKSAILRRALFVYSCLDRGKEKNLGTVHLKEINSFLKFFQKNLLEHRLNEKQKRILLKAEWIRSLTMNDLDQKDVSAYFSLTQKYVVNLSSVDIAFYIALFQFKNGKITIGQLNLAYARKMAALKKASRIYLRDNSPLWEIIRFKYHYQKNIHNKKKLMEILRNLFNQISKLKKIGGIKEGGDSHPTGMSGGRKTLRNYVDESLKRMQEGVFHLNAVLKENVKKWKEKIIRWADTTFQLPSSLLPQLAFSGVPERFDEGPKYRPIQYVAMTDLRLEVKSHNELYSEARRFASKYPVEKVLDSKMGFHRFVIEFLEMARKIINENYDYQHKKNVGDFLLSHYESVLDEIEYTVMTYYLKNRGKVAIDNVLYRIPKLNEKEESALTPDEKIIHKRNLEMFSSFSRFFILRTRFEISTVNSERNGYGVFSWLKRMEREFEKHKNSYKNISHFEFVIHLPLINSFLERALTENGVLNVDDSHTQRGLKNFDSFKWQNDEDKNDSYYFKFHQPVTIGSIAHQFGRKLKRVQDLIRKMLQNAKSVRGVSFKMKYSDPTIELRSPFNEPISTIRDPLNGHGQDRQPGMALTRQYLNLQNDLVELIVGDQLDNLNLRYFSTNRVYAPKQYYRLLTSEKIAENLIFLSLAENDRDIIPRGHSYDEEQFKFPTFKKLIYISILNMKYFLPVIFRMIGQNRRFPHLHVFRSSGNFSNYEMSDTNRFLQSFNLMSVEFLYLGVRLLPNNSIIQFLERPKMVRSRLKQVGLRANRYRYRPLVEVGEGSFSFGDMGTIFVHNINDLRESQSNQSLKNEINSHEGNKVSKVKIVPF